MIFFITGAGSGIGKATCLHALSHNHQVIGLLRNKEKAESLISEAKNLPGVLTLIFADLKSNHLMSVVSEQLANLGVSKIDALLNIAGTLSPMNLDEFNDKDIDEVMQVNFAAPAILINILSPLLEKSEKANIVNITSMSGFQGSVRFPGLSVYGASKAALSSLSESLAIELQDLGIRINALAIGAVSTNMLKEAFPDYQAPIAPEQMAEYIYSFATYGYKFYNGKTLPVAVTNP